MLTPIHGDKLWVYNVILRATPKKAILRDTLRSTRGKSKWNSKTYSSNPHESKTKKTETKNRTNRKHNGRSSPNISIITTWSKYTS